MDVKMADFLSQFTGVKRQLAEALTPTKGSMYFAKLDDFGRIKDLCCVKLTPDGDRLYDTGCEVLYSRACHGDYVCHVVVSGDYHRLMDVDCEQFKQAFVQGKSVNGVASFRELEMEIEKPRPWIPTTDQKVAELDNNLFYTVFRSSSLCKLFSYRCITHKDVLTVKHINAAEALNLMYEANYCVQHISLASKEDLDVVYATRFHGSEIQPVLHFVRMSGNEIKSLITAEYKQFNFTKRNALLTTYEKIKEVSFFVGDVIVNCASFGQSSYTERGEYGECAFAYKRKEPLLLEDCDSGFVSLLPVSDPYVSCFSDKYYIFTDYAQHALVCKTYRCVSDQGGLIIKAPNQDVVRAIANREGYSGVEFRQDDKRSKKPKKQSEEMDSF